MFLIMPRGSEIDTDLIVEPSQLYGQIHEAPNDENCNC